MDSAFSTLPHSIHKTPKHYKIRVFQKKAKKSFHLGGPEELDKKSSVFEELRPSAIQKHLIFRPTLQDPQDIEQKSQRLKIKSNSGTSATGPKWFWDRPDFKSTKMKSS